jgi:hypothetical protein
MVFTPHIITGGAISVLAKANPATSFVFGLLSHYMLDVLPHWDYPLLSSTKSSSENALDGTINVRGKAFAIDLVKVSIDFLIGLSITIYFFRDFYSVATLFTSPVLWGSFGAVLPDLLQFTYYQVKREPLTTHQRFHDFMHTDIRLKGRNILGPVLQIIFVIVVITLVTRFH